MEFNQFADEIEKQFNKMAKTGKLYLLDVPKDVVWNHYLDAYPKGTNEIYKERREHDCQTCKQFVRNVGNVVAIINNKIVTVWDIKTEYPFQEVCDSLSTFLKTKTIQSEFLTPESKYGNKVTTQVIAPAAPSKKGSIIDWNHFYCTVPNTFVSKDYSSRLSASSSTKHVFQRGLEEITTEAIDIVLDLINQKSLYRGEEFKTAIKSFQKLKSDYITAKNKDVFVWNHLNDPSSRIRNTAIGTLLQDLSEGKDLTAAVNSFESKVAPTNYKRTSSLVTKSMIEQALKTIDELGIQDSLQRRYAVTEDISINNVLFADRSKTAAMKDADKNSLKNLLMKNIPESDKQFKNVENISIEDFVKNVLPEVTSIEAFVSNKHKGNLVSLCAPVKPDAKNILQWNNNFTWSYNGDIADSMKERVKAAGGNVNGVLRFSIQWNDQRVNMSDLDAHCMQPGGELIYYGHRNGRMSGTLDVDIIHPQPSKPAVENIIFTDSSKMREGIYEFQVNVFNKRSGEFFSAELEFDGEIYSFEYDKPLKQKQTIDVARVSYSKKDGFKLIKSLPSSRSSKEIWGVNTEKFQKVSMLMKSPNHWDGQSVGNKHYFFMLDNCVNPDKTRGLYNEFLSNELMTHRKVFDMLGDKLKCETSTNQLSGLGFSTTQRNELICKVSGNFTRTLNVQF